MLRWAADIAAQRDQRSQHAGQPAPAAEDTARVQANRAAVAANEAYKAGDLDRAGELTEQAAALDPSRAGLWQQHRNDIAARRLITRRPDSARRRRPRAGQTAPAGRPPARPPAADPVGRQPAGPASQPSRGRAGAWTWQHRPGSRRHRPAPDPPGSHRAARRAGHRSRHGRPRWSSRPRPRRPAAPQARRDAASERSVLLATVRSARTTAQRHRPARRTLMRMRAMTPPAGRHPSPRSQPQAAARPPAADRGTRSHAGTGRTAPVTRARPEQAPGHRRTGATRFSARLGSRGSPARVGRTTLPSTGRRKPPPRSPESSPAGDAPPPGASWRAAVRGGLVGRGPEAVRGIAAPAAGQPRLRRARHRGGPVGSGSGNGQPSPGRSRTCCRGSVTSREPPTVNQYGEMARRHWARWLPNRLRGDREPGDVLHRPGEPGGGEDHRAGLGTGRGRPAGRGVPGEGGPARGGTAPGRADRAGRDDPAASRSREPARPARSRAAVARFRPGGQDDLAPSGAVSRVRANLAALVGAAHRPAARAVPPRPPSRKSWPAGRGGARCRRYSMTAATSSPGRASSSPCCCRRRSWRRPGGTR